MSTRKENIRSELRTHLLTYGTLPEVQWENRYFEIPTDANGDPKPYIRETLITSDEDLTANNEKTGLGFYALNYFVPSGFDIFEAERVAGDIKELFKPAQVIGSLIIEKSIVLEGEPDPPWYMIPIRAYYRAHQSNN